MITYIIRRTFHLVFLLFLLSLITFFLMHAVPGNPFQSAKMPLSDEVVRSLKEYYNLNAPLWKQYVDWIGKALQGDLGPTYSKRGRTVNDIIVDFLPVSMQLGVLAFIVSVVTGIPLGVIAAIKPNSFLDYLTMSFAVVGVSVPAITLGPLLIWLFAVRFKVLPVAGWGTWQQAVLPVITLGTASSAVTARLTRASLLEILDKDYIRTAWAKGVSNKRVYSNHALRNALIPVITGFGPRFAALVTGTFVVEKIFAVPGLGRFFVDSVFDRDYPVIMGTVLLFGAILVIANLIVDITYAWLDPRITYD